MDASNVLEGTLEYYSYRFGRSGLVFRGPKRKLEGRYVATIGGSETYGKFVPDPFPNQLEAVLGLPVVNFGCMHASVGVFAEDEAVLDACRDADITVIQVMGAVNNSNKFYSVHPRRNDRFLKAASPLRELYPNLDFAEFNFTRHLLSSLAESAPDAFEEVRREIKAAWVERMKLLIDKIGGRIVLLWMSERAPDAPDDMRPGADPLFVDRAMLDELRDDVADIVEVVASENARAEGLEGKCYLPPEAQAAAEVPGPAFHLETAMALADSLAPFFEEAEEEATQASAAALRQSV